MLLPSLYIINEGSQSYVMSQEENIFDPHPGSMFLFAAHRMNQCVIRFMKPCHSGRGLSQLT